MMAYRLLQCSLVATTAMAAMGCGTKAEPSGRTAKIANAIAETRPPIMASSPTGTISGSFEVTGDGAATYSIPIVVPRGRAGLEPSLSLSYSSRGGNGSVGVGWALSGMSAVSRCRPSHFRDGEVRPIQFDDSDVYCLDGARLVEVADENAAPPSVECQARHKDFRTEPDSFARVVMCDWDNTGPLAWFVYGKGGRIERYGATSSSVMQVKTYPHDQFGDGSIETDRRATWLLDRVQDRVGNYMTYTYAHFEAAGTLETLEVLPTRIDYTGFDGAGGGETDPCHENIPPNRSVVFEYEGRSDLTSGYLHGIELTRTVRLKTITTNAPSPPEQQLPYVRQYGLEYKSSPSTSRSLLGQVQVCDGLGGCPRPTKFTYSTTNPVFHDWPQGAAAGAPEIFQPIDVNGDGKDDLYVVAFDAEYVRVAGGTVSQPTLADGRDPEIPAHHAFG